MANKGVTRSDDARKKISEARTGKHLSEESKRKVSESKKGKPSTRIGATLSDSTKAKLSELRIGKRATYETRLKMCETSLGGLWYGKVVYDTDPQYCEKWTNRFRERVRAAFNYTCQFPGCGYVWKEGDKRLAVHHINYRKDACCNPEVRPLFIPVCAGACHAKTNNDRKSWERHFTELIESEYDGKCYLAKEEMISYF
jgi:hypothetical protein